MFLVRQIVTLRCDAEGPGDAPDVWVVDRISVRDLTRVADDGGGSGSGGDRGNAGSTCSSTFAAVV